MGSDPELGHIKDFRNDICCSLVFDSTGHMAGCSCFSTVYIADGWSVMSNVFAVIPRAVAVLFCQKGLAVPQEDAHPISPRCQMS